MPVGGGEETEVLPSITNWNFAVMDDGIYFLTGTSRRYAIEFLNFATSKTEVVAPVGGGLSMKCSERTRAGNSESPNAFICAAATRALPSRHT
jgi:hypothetical protein